MKNRNAMEYTAGFNYGLHQQKTGICKIIQIQIPVLIHILFKFSKSINFKKLSAIHSDAA